MFIYETNFTWMMKGSEDGVGHDARQWIMGLEVSGPVLWGTQLTIKLCRVWRDPRLKPADSCLLLVEGLMDYAGRAPSLLLVEDIPIGGSGIARIKDARKMLLLPSVWKHHFAMCNMPTEIAHEVFLLMFSSHVRQYEAPLKRRKCSQRLRKGQKQL